MDVVELRDFYASAYGEVTAGLLSAALRPLVRPAPDHVVMGLGFAPPLLEHLMPEGQRSFAFMPARQGVIHWPSHHDVASALVDIHDLPLLESTVDLALVVHGLEQSDDPLDMLRECWRVLSPQGRLILVVPNRRGLWSMFENNPFGYGQPFSRSQLAKLLKQAQFTACGWRSALYMPPSASPLWHRMAKSFERAGPYMAKGVAGVTIVEAQKQVYAFSAGKRARRFLPRLNPIMLPSRRPASRHFANCAAHDYEGLNTTQIDLSHD
jgi:SAM-dependent methyltransferase